MKNPRVLSEADALEELRRFVARIGSQNKAAEALGVSQTFVQQMLVSKSPIPNRILEQIGLTRETTIKVKRSA